MGAVAARRRFTVDEYECMGRAGIIHEDERVELIDGEIYQMAPIGGRHVWGVTRGTTWFGARLSGRAFISVQSPIRLSRGSEPEPDIVLLAPRAARDTSAVPTAEDVPLLIEVADTSLAYDRRTKLPRYAQAGIPEVWIMDLDSGHIEVYREPAGRRYRSTTVFERGSHISPLAFPDLAVPCNELLP